MIGKELKVAEYQVSFGNKPRMVNVFSLFRYKKNNSLYVIYADVGATINVINYGGSHIKGSSILCMSPKEEDLDYVKEFVFKVTKEEELEGFETVSLDDIEEIEIISSGHMEVKSDVFSSLVDLTIPKPVVSEDKEKVVKKKKGGFLKLLIFLIIMGAIFVGVYYYTDLFRGKDNDVKMVSCSKTYSHKTLDAVVEDNRVYRFGSGDVLSSVEVTTAFQFRSKEGYENFILKGTMYKYMPDDSSSGGVKQDDEKNIFTFISTKVVDEKYVGPTGYENVLVSNKDDGYQCDEKLLEE